MSMNIEHQYLGALGWVLNSGVHRDGRNGGTTSLFGHQMRHDMREGFPLLTTKKVHFKSILVELLWFLKGDTNIDFLHQHGVKIWDEWADAGGNLGPIYGAQWRSWNSGQGYWIDQIAKLIENLKKDPFSRRHIVSAWNPAEVDQMALPPCHTMFQFHVAPGRHKAGDDEHDVLFLDLQLYQRSADMFLGVPFNIASYALLLQLMAREVHMVPRYFVHTLGDFHVYDNHKDAVLEQIQREPMRLPEVIIKPASVVTMDLLEFDDFELVGYESHPAIKGEVSK